jgi:hypothetical protein
VQVRLALDSRLDEMVAVNSGGCGDFLPQGLHELKHGGLPQHVLQNDAIGMEE